MNEDVFEMAAPSLFSQRGAFLKSGARSRENDLDDAQRERVLGYCRDSLVGASYPAAGLYPDLRAS